MAKLIEAEALTTFDVVPDGTRVRLHMQDVGGEAATLSLPFETLAQLMMTMPEMARRAFRARYGDDRLRIVYPIGGWKIERCGEPGRLILTLRTSDGFEISFSLDSADCAALTEGLSDAPAAATAAALQ